ncbi:diguanylate cyclase domain-containing protein [Burkholderia sp. LMU1-1-1.1]|uniref:diguanylate cyclase domain-containing protein n=1 Tax=Burkholderia sp. LMU1-1-1.1 TaxID=3135266 RepID=UPI00344A26D0
MTAHTDSPTLASLRTLYRSMLLPAFALLVLALMWSAVIYQVRQEKKSARFEAVLHSQSLAHTLAEHANHLLRQTDHATQLFKLKFEESGGALRVAEFTANNGMLDTLMPTKFNLPFARLDAAGKVVDRGNGYFPPDLHHQAFFKSHAASAEQRTVVATPVVEPRTNKWQIQISRRLDGPGGRFAGVVLALLDPADLVDDYDRVNVDNGGAVILISRENGLATARIDEQIVIGDAIDFRVVPRSATRPADELLLKRPFDAVDRIYGYAEMPRFLLMAAVGNPVPSAMAGFAKRRTLYYGAVTVASLLVLAVAGLLMRQARRVRDSARQVIEAQLLLRAAADASLDALYLLKARRAPGAGGEITDFVIADLNEHAAARLGYQGRDIKGKPLREVAPHLHSSGLVEKFKQVLATGRPLEEEVERDRSSPGPSGERWLHRQVVAIDNGVAVTTRDITPHKEAELAMRKNQAELAAVNDASPLGLIRADAAGHCTYVNRTFEFITGLRREEALGDAWMRAVHPSDRPVLRKALRRMVRTRLPHQDTLRCIHPDGMMIWISFKVAAMVVDGQVYGYVGTVDDITHVRKSVMALRESEARLRTITDTLPAMVAYVDYEEVYRFHNVAYEREFKRGGMAVLGKTIRQTMGEERYAVLAPYIQRVLAGEALTFEEDDSSGGDERTFEVAYIPQRDEDDVTVMGFHVMRQDVTAQKREKQRLFKLSQVDALTGLTNRAGFLQKLDEGMAAHREGGGMMAVMYMDIDRFKPVNDTFGHSVGDALLKIFSARLTHAMRASDTIARLGGDEFTVIMERIQRVEDGTALAAKIVGVMQAPFDLSGTVVSVSASIGLAYYQGEDITPAELLNRADMLLYEAKQAGRNTFRTGAALA